MLRLPLLPLLALLVIAALRLPLLALRLSLRVIPALLPHFAARLPIGPRLAALLALGAGFTTAAAHFGAARSTVTTVAALRDLHPLARCLCGCGSDGGQDRCRNQQSSEHLLHLAILQLMSRLLERPAGMMT
ncbi:hypothetical protein [Sphingopyxis sp. RIFCSPHIGHO2_12_FULL_65_19]|uniref:hypothetical protein n=1 Tax=Sphingopyxis sp. RIFCSPHIGHO2_12_FULL_65_19 TaxID=1802172 RepID=UPI0025EC4E01|nr:hypothetical protein [Sphingopyxis sp. RIFCSPHIGHO2_12_FULL_65_19]